MWGNAFGIFLYSSDWKTYPQLFINGEFVGGCDVVTELFESGELKKMLEKAGAFSEPEEAETPASTVSKWCFFRVLFVEIVC